MHTRFITQLAKTSLLTATLVASLFVLPADAAAKVDVIKRSEWGANESLTFKSTSATVKKEATTDVSKADKDEKDGIDPKASKDKLDPDVARIVTKDKEGKEYLWPLSYAKKASFIVVHHTALTKHLNDPKADMKALFQSHAVSRGWGDIGYNYLIDQQGKIYEGRKGGEKVIGGHSIPLNKVSIGIALLGNYEDSEITAPMVNSLIKLIDEKSQLYKIDPDGKTSYKGKKYNNIQGHFENDATLCPGFYTKDALPDLRELIAYNQNFYSTNTAKTSTDSVQGNPHMVPAQLSLVVENTANSGALRAPFKLIKKPDVLGVKPGHSKLATLRIENTSGKSWNTTTYLENTDIPALPKILGRIKYPVKNNDSAEFTITIPALYKSDFYTTHLRLVINGSEKSNFTLPYPVLVENVVTSYELVSMSKPTQPLKSGEVFTGKIVIKNTGNIDWNREGPYALKIGTINPKDHLSNLLGGKNRLESMKEKLVLPGQTATFSYTLTQPKNSTNKAQRESLGPVIDGIGWLKGPTLEITTQASIADKAVRVRLSNSKGNQFLYRLSSTSGLALLNKLGKPQQSFAVGHDVVVTAGTTSGYVVTDASTGKRTNSSTPPRFMALKKDGVVVVNNFEKRPAWNQSLNDNQFKGVIEVRSEKTGLYPINELPLEEYMHGLAEVPNDDEPEKAKALAIAARSYAAYYRDIKEKFPGKPYDLDDDPDHTQKYLGAGFESRSATALTAVKATEGLIVTYLGKPVITPYFNQSDGRTRSAKELWGWSDAPYLQSVPDAFCGGAVLKGHGVGLSGCGATALAKQGKTAEEILKYYYKGIEIKRL